MSCVIKYKKAGHAENDKEYRLRCPQKLDIDWRMVLSAQLIVLQEYIDTVTDCIDYVHRLTEQIRLQSRQSRRPELIQALQAMRGISLIVAAIIASELGDLTRLENPGKPMAFLGLIPSEHSSGDQVKKGWITKTWNRQVLNAQMLCKFLMYIEYSFPGGCREN